MIYEKNCNECKKITLHLVISIHRNRGVKLRCLLCSNETPSFYNVKRLREVQQWNLLLMKGGYFR